MLNSCSSFFQITFISFKNINLYVKAQCLCNNEIQKPLFFFKNFSFIQKSYIHSKILFSFENSCFHSKIWFSFKKVVFTQKLYLHSLTFQFVNIEITGQSRDHMIPIVYKKTDEWYIEWQRVVQRVATSGQRVTRETTSDHFG